VASACERYLHKPIHIALASLDRFDDPARHDFLNYFQGHNV
jgi:hypothetical protein